MTRALLAAGSPAGQVLLKFVGGGGTFTRASEGSYYTGPDTLAWATSNVLRGPDLRNATSYPMWLFEGAKTNGITSSENLSVGSWSNVLGATRTAAGLTAPDGEADAFTATFPANALSMILASQTGTLGQNTVSVWLRTTVGTYQFRLHARNATDGQRTSADFTATTTWQRFSFTFTNTGIANHFVGVQCGTSAVAGTVAVWGVQLELTAFPTSYIRTTVGAVTRSADALTYAAGPRAFFSGKWEADIAYEASSAEGSASPITPFSASASLTDMIYAPVAPGTYYNGNLGYVKSAGTWSRDQVIRYTFDQAGALMTQIGCTTGDGTGPVGIPISWAGPQANVGARGSGATPFFGRVAEPRLIELAPTAPRIGGFNATPTGYRSAVATIIPGVNTGFWIAAMVRVNSLPSASGVVASCYAVGRGWILQSFTSTTFRAYFHNGAGTLVSSTPFTVVAADVGRTMLVVYTYDGANNIQGYRRRVSLGAAACVGYTPATAAERASIGVVSPDSSAPLLWADVIGFSSGTGVPALADVQAWDTASKLARAMTPMGGAGVAVTDLWRAEDWSPGNDWTANVGGKVLVREGSPTRTTDTLIWE